MLLLYSYTPKVKNLSASTYKFTPADEFRSQFSTRFNMLPSWFTLSFNMWDVWTLSVLISDKKNNAWLRLFHIIENIVRIFLTELMTYLLYLLDWRALTASLQFWDEDVIRASIEKITKGYESGWTSVWAVAELGIVISSHIIMI